MAQTDLILLILISLSILVGLNRGFCAEILGLAVYIFSGVLGYAFAPAFMSAFSFITFEPAQRGVSILVGTFVAWIVLKMITASLVSAVKKSELNKLDRSLGALFGSVRAGVFLIIIVVILAFASPSSIQSSRILTLSYAGAGQIFKQFPELGSFVKKEQNEENPDPEPQGFDVSQNQNWKKRLLYFLENTTVDTKDGEKKLISSVSAILAKSAAKEMMQGFAAPETQEGEVSDEKYEKFLEYVSERQIIAWLNEEPIDEEEIRDALVKKMKEENEHSGD